ncbi:class 3 adenylate cyclase [Agromyces flavus]|uniref:Adenylate cyclase, class 3 n=1 Tax=Agromyces flavus TaxID=589382 RepID=A0A1H1TGH0_9MICO|nr:adenylate/guanylate cyclase domain-containing protein [Agromyces flavus]MCP2368427.1 class 3 adenylate cyclase [Agromyces flavus]GGI47887.1 hydrolase [Agromyces flavus]SDS59342.1 Adenylate cyclase, class 3 [Agromyces flavus]
MAMWLSGGPEPRYARSDEGDVAYQVFGHGPRDLLLIGNWASNIEIMWEHPTMARYLERLGRFARVICFDKRGVGLSDPVPMGALPTLEQWVDDARGVLDAAGSEQVAILGDAEGGPMAMMFAATHPQRTRALVLVNSFARMLRADDYPIGMPEASSEKLLEEWQPAWGTGSVLRLSAPTVADDPQLQRWVARYGRLSASPRTSTRIYRWVLHVDVRSILPSIKAPTLVVHKAGNRHYRPAMGRFLAEGIPDAKYVEVPGADWYPAFVDSDGILDAVEEFLTGDRPAVADDRVLATVLFTDIVGSTDAAARLGDQRWLELKTAHDELVRAELDRYRGREIATTGDGFLAIFDGPARAVRCATDIAAAVRSLGIDIRAGLHSGEVELREGQVAGIAVHIAARVLALAGPGRVLVSGTVKDLVVGSGIRFVDRGSHALKGVPDEWRLFEVAERS